jgi:DNA topoisomerase-1
MKRSRRSRRRRPVASRQRAVLIDRAIASARAAGLTYVNDAAPGLARRRSGTGFSYKDADGVLVRDAATLRRIRSLAIPPAWTSVWICPDPKGHIQATGRDARGRKQYRYHPQWRETRDETKFDRMVAFGTALPRIRARVEADLRKRGLPRTKVLACVVRLLETTLIRVGNEEYARQNASYGLTTLRNRHVEITTTRLRFKFKGKSGKHHVIDVADPRLARLVKQVQELPGQELLQYVDDDGFVRAVASDDVNAYLRDVAGDDFTAKDFRTWAGTVLAARALLELGEKASKKDINEAVRAVSQKLGNTLTVCRKSYVHPAVFSARGDGSLAKAFATVVVEGVDGLRGDEACVLALLAQVKTGKDTPLLELLAQSVAAVDKAAVADDAAAASAA